MSQDYGLFAQYYANTRADGLPVLERIDPVMDFDWGHGAPDPALPSDYFSVRWRGWIVPEHSGQYELRLRSDDGVRMWLNGHLGIDDWRDRGPTTSRAAWDMEAGQAIAVEITYYERQGGAMAQLSWQRPDGVTEVIPQDCLLPGDGSPNGGGTGLSGFYYHDKLVGEPFAQRQDPQIAFNWGKQGPFAAGPIDHFSVRWLGYISPRSSGHYVIATRTDDGVSLWVDNQRLIHAWYDTGATLREASIYLEAGRMYPIRLEYYEAKGNAVAELYWRCEGHEPWELIPRDYLYPADALMARVPETSEVSPISLEWYLPFGDEAMVTADGQSPSSVRIGDASHYAAIDLSPQQPVAVTLTTATGESKSGAVHWRALQLDGQDNGRHLVIRAGDRLLCAGEHGHLVRSLGYDETDYGAVTASGTPVAFPEPGFYQLALRSQGSVPEVLGTVTVDVVAVALPPMMPSYPFPLSRDYYKTIGFPLIQPEGAWDQVVATAEAPDFALTLGGTSADQSFTAGGDRIGHRFAVARLRESNAILAVVPFVIFEVDRTGIYHLDIASQEWTEDRSSCRIEAEVIIRPPVEGVKLSFHMFASRSRFDDEQTRLSVSTSGGPTSVGTPGFTINEHGEQVLRFGIHIPLTEFSYCIRTRATMELLQ